MKKYLIALMIFLTVAVAVTAQAYVFGPSNLSGGYPEHRCRKPDIPYDNDKWAWDMFVNNAKQYEQCINEYVEGTNNDRNRVIEAGNQAIEEYNLFIRNLKR